MVRVFLDANVYFSGFFSQRGASALLLELVQKKKIKIAASRLVLREADRNLRKKADAKIRKIFHQLLNQTKIQIAPPPDEKVLENYYELIHPKDAPVLAAAAESKVDFLITLDRRHLLTPKVKSHIKHPKILTPGDFLTSEILR